MTIEQLISQIHKKRSFLCIGLDTDHDKIPTQLLDEEDPIFAFNKAIIDATHHLCVAYKPNTAFYEAYGPRGWEALSKTAAYIKEVDPELFSIADAKRGDIGNTATRYAKPLLPIKERMITSLEMWKDRKCSSECSKLLWGMKIQRT